MAARPLCRRRRGLVAFGVSIRMSTQNQYSQSVTDRAVDARFFGGPYPPRTRRVAFFSSSPTVAGEKGRPQLAKEAPDLSFLFSRVSKVILGEQRLLIVHTVHGLDGQSPAHNKKPWNDGFLCTNEQRFTAGRAGVPERPQAAVAMSKIAAEGEAAGAPAGVQRRALVKVLSARGSPKGGRGCQKKNLPAFPRKKPIPSAGEQVMFDFPVPFFPQRRAFDDKQLGNRESVSPGSSEEVDVAQAAPEYGERASFAVSLGNIGGAADGRDPFTGPLLASGAGLPAPTSFRRILSEPHS